MSRFRPVWIHQSLRAGEQGRKRRNSLLQGEMDHSFHYQGVRQAQLWLEVHHRHAPLFTDLSFCQIFRDISVETAATLAGSDVHVIGLGPGGGEKEAWLLEALRDAGCNLRYTPVDTSLELALLSAEAAEPFVETEILPVVGDLSLLTDSLDWMGRYPAGEIRVYTAFGLTPNFLPSQLYRWLSEVLRERDILLLSANLAPIGLKDDTPAAYRAACESILPQYDNPETRAWLGQVLVDWGIASKLTEPVFQIESIEDILAFLAHCTWLADEDFSWEGEPFHADRGDRLRLFFSLRYTPGRLAEALKRHGLALETGRITACGQEGVWRVRLDRGGLTVI